MRRIQNLLVELDKLKSVYRRAYLADGSRNKNSAEHSWHLAVALMAFREVIPESVNIDHAIQMALVHDICEIRAGDVSIFDSEGAEQSEAEGEFMSAFKGRHGSFGQTAADLWHEFERQESTESKWVKVVARFLPFILNLATQGRTWKEQGICRSQVLSINKGIHDASPELFEWMECEIEVAVQSGWLIDA